MEWENEACDECKKNCLLIHRKRVLSFSKTMTGKSCLQVLIFPPKFARSVSHLTDQETYLEDSSGLQWRVTVSSHNGSLAIRQGWPEFATAHGLDVDDLLVFHYATDQHFNVQIFGRNGCEKIMFCRDIGKGVKRARTFPEETTPVELETTDVNSVKKKSKTSQFENSGEENANGHEKVVKSKPAGLGDTPSLPAINYECSVTVVGREFLELPETWADLLKRPDEGRWIIFLRGPDKRIWPTYYHSRSHCDVLTSGWEKVAAAYGVNVGDDCLFQLVDQKGQIFDIRKI